MYQNLNKRNQKIKDKPYINHFNCACKRQCLTDTNKHCCKNKHNLYRKIQITNLCYILVQTLHTVKFTVRMASKKIGFR